MEGDKIKLYKLVRKKDIHGVSGIGLIALIAVFPSGRAILEWVSSNHPTLTIFNGGIQEIELIHGHNGTTTVEKLDEKKKTKKSKSKKKV